jgi:multidrug efflux pump subunit AcrA (membrane-fusion protein)
VKAQRLLDAAAAAALICLCAGCGPRAESETIAPKPVVTVMRPQRAEMVRSIEFPGDLVGFYETALHAKVTGYLQSITVDKGDWVRAGQVLATIEVPELHSNLANAQASLQIARVTYDRLRKVQQSDARLISQQDVDIAFAKFQQAQASVRTLQTMVNYTQIAAPFSGVITGRFADPGALIRAGGGDFGVNEIAGTVSPGATEGSGGHREGGGPVLTMAQVDTLRVYVYVPEQVCSLVARGTPATLRFDEFPGRVFKGAVTRFANSLDLATRTMMTEIDIDNRTHRLYPRMYAHVTLDLVRHPDAIRLPVGALGGSGEGAYVLVVQHGRLHQAPVATGINDGRYVEITSGLRGDELVVANLNPALSSGEAVAYQMEGDGETPPSKTVAAK